MDFIMATDGDGIRTLYPNKSNTPKDVLKCHEIVEFAVPTDKIGLMELLQDFLDQTVAAPPEEPAIEERHPLHNSAFNPTSYTERSIAIDDAWEELPLARKLHFAAMAMEDARDAIKPMIVKPASPVVE